MPSPHPPAILPLVIAIAPAYRRILLAALLLAALLVSLTTLELLDLPADAAAGDIERVSVHSIGGEADATSNDPAISGDGRFVAFNSKATDLVASDTNGTQDIFVHDRQTGQTTRVNVDSLGGEANGFSANAAISGDGRFVAFYSDATNLVDDDTNDSRDIFVHDRQTGQTTRVSVDSLGGEADGNSFGPSLSDDGRFVAFSSQATGLVTGDTNGTSDVFVHDRQTGETTRVSVDSLGGEADGSSSAPAITGDGRFVAFDSSATNLVTGDTNGVRDVFVHDRQTSQTIRVSFDSFGGEADDFSSAPAITGDGRFVAFESNATNLVAGDTNGVLDIFVHDRQTEETTRVSVDSLGGEANGGSSSPAISSDGRFVAFDSVATNLVPGDNNGVRDIFVHDRGIEPTPTPSPTATPAPANALWGDDDCNGAVAAVDALKNLQHVADIEFTQNDPCFPLGETVGVSPAGVTDYLWGDVDCDQDVDAVDALAILRSIAAFPPLETGPDCPDIGAPVIVG
ncbi:MAG: PD40 domain-containing protein [Chloroflexi bacterium]|nr:PD40 domain-containing protein [Chloroflexota bacterium]